MNTEINEVSPAFVIEGLIVTKLKQEEWIIVFNDFLKERKEDFIPANDFDDTWEDLNM